MQYVYRVCMGSIWAPIQPETEQRERLFCLHLFSSLLVWWRACLPTVLWPHRQRCCDGSAPTQLKPHRWFYERSLSPLCSDLNAASDGLLHSNSSSSPLPNRKSSTLLLCGRTTNMGQCQPATRRPLLVSVQLGDEEDNDGHTLQKHNYSTQVLKKQRGTCEPGLNLCASCEVFVMSMLDVPSEAVKQFLNSSTLTHSEQFWVQQVWGSFGSVSVLHTVF